MRRRRGGRQASRSVHRNDQSIASSPDFRPSGHMQYKCAESNLADQIAVSCDKVSDAFQD